MKPLEQTKDFLMKLRGNADTAIGNPNLDISWPEFSMDVDLGNLVSRNKFQRVGNQVVEYLAHRGRMSFDPPERPSNFDPGLPFFDLLFDGSEHVAQSTVHIDRDQFQIRGVEAAILEQIQQ